MKTIQKNILPILLAISTLTILAFSNKKTYTQNEYLTIAVEYRLAAQLMYISEGTKDLQKLAVLTKDAVLATQKKFKRRGFDIHDKRIDGTMDNTEIIRLLNSFEKDGWTLNSHSMAIGDNNEELFVCQSMMVQYLMTREINETTD